MFSKTHKVCDLLTQANEELEERLVKAVAKERGIPVDIAKREVAKMVAEKVERLCRV